MSQITYYRRINGVLTNASTVTLSDSTGTYGILRLDNRAVSVAAGTATSNPQTGIYTYDTSALDPTYTYVASWKIVSTFGTTYHTEVLNPQGTTVTRGQIRANAARIMNLLRAEGTTTAATSSTITDASTFDGGLAAASDSQRVFDGCFILMTSGPAMGQWREITPGVYNPAAGTLTVSPQWNPSPTLGGGDNYEIYAAIRPDDWSLRDNYTVVDNALKRCRYVRRTPLTLVPDGDMESSGVSSWTPTTAALVKSTIEAVSFGTQSMLVINSSANGFAESQSIGVIPTRGYSVWADYRCVGSSVSTATLQVWDATNHALIQTGVDPDNGVNMEGGRITCSFSVPSNCYQITIRLIGAESNAVVAWDDIILVTAGRRRYPSPSWIKARDQIMQYQQRNGVRPYEDMFYNVGYPLDVQEDPSAVVTFMVDLPNSAVLPVFVMGEAEYGPMTDTADNITTNCPLEWAMYSAAREAFVILVAGIEGATQAKVDADRTVVEARCAQLDRIYMPLYQSTVGIPSWAGIPIRNMP